jgi:hypothetical protein
MKQTKIIINPAKQCLINLPASSNHWHSYIHHIKISFKKQTYIHDNAFARNRKILNPTLFPHTITIAQLLLGVKKEENLPNRNFQFYGSSTVSQHLKTAITFQVTHKRGGICNTLLENAKQVVTSSCCAFASCFSSNNGMGSEHFGILLQEWMSHIEGICSTQYH